MSEKKTWIEVDPIYLTDDKKKPIEAFVFLNHCTYNPNLKRPVLRRTFGHQTLTASTPDELGEAVVALATRPNARLLAEGISHNDWKVLPREDWHPSPEVIEGTAPIYENVDDLRR